jgi:hydroxyethylthiazole kinase-like uncharacterized protein yjeF
MKIVTVEGMRRIEKLADEGGHTYARMMESAGSAVADAIKEVVPSKDCRVLVLVGPGNNGGDGLVAARHLHDWGADVSLYIWNRNVRSDSNYQQARQRKIPTLSIDRDRGLRGLRQLIRESDVIVDSLLGTGVSRPIEGGLKEMLEALGQEVRARRAAPPKNRMLRHITEVALPVRHPAPRVVAVDVPTGLNCDTGAVDPVTPVADVTVTFGFPKRGQFLYPGASHLGELLVADIGIPDGLADDVSTRLATPELVRDILPERPQEAHKGTFGKALVVAGSVNYTGAAYLASAAATRVGAGLVSLALAESLHPILASKLAEVTFLLLPHYMGSLVPEACRVLGDHTDGYSALLVGPGLGRDPRTSEFVMQLLTGEAPGGRELGFVRAREQATREQVLPPTVIDADGCNALADTPEWWTSLTSGNVLTPHPGEMSRLLGCSVAEIQSDRIEVALRASQRWDQIVVLKGAYTVIAEPGGQATINPFANPALASAGTGDVLAGAVVGLLAQGVPAYDAAVAAAYIHGLAGQRASREIGQAGVVASDLLPRLPMAIRLLREPNTPFRSNAPER